MMMNCTNYVLTVTLLYQLTKDHCDKDRNLAASAVEIISTNFMYWEFLRPLDGDTRIFYTIAR